MPIILCQKLFCNLKCFRNTFRIAAAGLCHIGLTASASANFGGDLLDHLSGVKTAGGQIIRK